MMRAFSVRFMVISALLLAGCSSKVEWNQKLTVTVEIDGQEYVGSSVSRMRYTSAGKVAFASRGNSVSERFSGEAAVIDLGEHGYLFALWRTQSGQYAISEQSRKRKIRSGPDYQSAKNYKSARNNNMSFLRKVSYSRRIQVLEPGSCSAVINTEKTSSEKSGNYPLLVAFKQLKFPSTIVGFNQCGKNWQSGTFNSEGFSKFYGGNAKVKQIIFQVTDEPITQGRVSAVLDNAYFEKWQKKVSAYRYKCTLKTQNPYFCNLHKGQWVKIFSGDLK